MQQRTSIILTLVCLLIGGVVGWLLKPCPCANIGTVRSAVDVPMLEIRTLSPDTVRLPGRIRYRTIRVKAKAQMDSAAAREAASVPVPDRSVLVHDTAARCPDGRYCVGPFVSDTTAVMPDGDSIRVLYEFPQNIITLMRRQVPDTLRHTTRVVTISAGEAPRSTFWETVGTHAAAVCVGFLLGRVGQ